jgi:chemotaxis protein MotA
MLAIVGIAVVTLSVLVGFTMEGGPLLVLLQPAEFLIIGGAAIGGLLIATSPSLLRRLVRQSIAATRPSPFTRALYLELLQLLYELLVKAKRNGLIALEEDLAAPADSPIFTRYPALLERADAIHFTCEALAMLVDGTMRPDDFEMVLNAHLETHHEEQSKPASALAKVGDTLPGLGIVAAVLGIVITMQSVNGPPEQIGKSVAAALVGTFLGVFLSYGYVQPLTSNLELQAAAEARFLQCIKNCLVAFARGAPPMVAVEVARHVMFTEDRPDAEEVIEACQAVTKRAA